MGAQNRSAYSGSRRSSGRGMGLLKGVGLMFVLAALSFTLGFFVLARLLPGNQRQEASRSIETASSNNGAAANPAAAPTVNTPPVTAPTVPQNAPTPSNVPPSTAPSQTNKTPGPSIDPLTDDSGPVQQPDTVDKPNNAAASGDAANGAGRNPFNSVTPNTPLATTQTPTTHHRRRRHHPAAPAPDGVQTPAQPDNSGDTNSDTTTTPSSPDTGSGNDNGTGGTNGNDTNTPHNDNAAPSTSSRSGVYRVQLGVYSTRERAEQEAQPARDKGIRIHVQPYTGADGRTLYRVQQGVYRHRASAEAALQRLTDAGIQAAISKP